MENMEMPKTPMLDKDAVVCMCHFGHCRNHRNCSVKLSTDIILPMSTECLRDKQQKGYQDHLGSRSRLIWIHLPTPPLLRVS